MPFAFWKKRNASAPPQSPLTQCFSTPAGVHRELLSSRLCTSCGACCAFFLVSFPSTELHPAGGGLGLSSVAARLDDSRSYMIGTEKRWFPRCIALEGQVGSCVRCTIYDDRPSSCRTFLRSWQDDIGNELCDKARCAFGLQPFSRF